MDAVKAKIEEGSRAQEGLEEELRAKDADIKTLQATFASQLYLDIYKHTLAEHC